MTFSIEIIERNFHFRVKGINGLRVADGSVIPMATSSNTQATIIMIGEKVSDIIKAEWDNKSFY